MRLPRWVRRILTYVALYVLLLFTVAASPLLVIVALVLSHWLPGKWRALRLLGFAIVGLLAESAAVITAGALWIASGFGAAIRSRRFQDAHYAALRWVLAVLVGSARRLFQLDLTTDVRSWSPLDDGVPGSTNAMLVLSRHAGPGDSLLLMNTLMNSDHLRRTRVVLKDAMQFDPVCDLYLNRLPAKFVNPNPGPGEDMPSGIAALADGMSDKDALLIFPEGGNFTPKRRTRAIQRLTDAGHTEAATSAQSLKHLLPPRPAGVLAALDAAPSADVVFVAHTGLDHMLTARDIWREIPVHKRLHMRWTFVPAADVPTDRDQRVNWLNTHWSDIDRWVEANSA
ncbi:acyltransferase-like protein [Antricoccus suffuscus]|uniref:Acyltransferase-like protein n=1 Tax=Antricoccus suffuscus TaxID=1629062 RepID=A0A2T1A6Y5_9ACTN|nr:lysophospholipid acyltransferase family protein [Antricoccus suffuscus]PRZ44088.1 acyltransferase-like protein [Antricoccus suffuscus]